MTELRLRVTFNRISSLPSNLVTVSCVSESHTASVSDTSSCIPPAIQNLHLYFNLTVVPVNSHGSCQWASLHAGEWSSAFNAGAGPGPRPWRAPVPMLPAHCHGHSRRRRSRFFGIQACYAVWFPVCSTMSHLTLTH